MTSGQFAPLDSDAQYQHNLAYRARAQAAANYTAQNQLTMAGIGALAGLGQLGSGLFAPPAARIGKVTPKPGVIGDRYSGYRWKTLADYKWWERVIIWWQT